MKESLEVQSTQLIVLSVTVARPLVRRDQAYTTHTHKTWTRAVHQFSKSVNLGFEILEAIESKSLNLMQ